VSTTRILVLGLLDTRGPMHGHQMKRHVELTSLETWGDVRVGALYGALHRMAVEGLISEQSREQAGRFPARTVYAITDEGRLELALLRDRALQSAHLANDPFDVALATCELTLAATRPLLAQRRASFQAELHSLVSERERLVAAGYLSLAQQAVFRHVELRITAELHFLDDLQTSLPAIVADRAARKQ
jgi:DNA-binding PadR family transcriptional regulator